MRRLDRMTSWVRLSRARPKNAFQSPGAYRRIRSSRRPTRLISPNSDPAGGASQAGVARGRSRGATLLTLRGAELARQLAHPAGEPIAPRQVPAMRRDIRDVELQG